MIKSGIAASKGYAIGKVFIQEHEEIVINDNKISDIEAEKNLLRVSLQASREQLTKIKEKRIFPMAWYEYVSYSFFKNFK